MKDKWLIYIAIDDERQNTLLAWVDYRPPTNLREGNVFIRVYLSVEGRGSDVTIVHDAMIDHTHDMLEGHGGTP